MSPPGSDFAPGAVRARGFCQLGRFIPSIPIPTVFHFPVAFPEVFLRGREGFDVIVGNPPWEEAAVEEAGCWGRHFPGFRSLPQRDFASKPIRGANS
jgi:hypothetical protein